MTPEEKSKQKMDLSTLTQKIVRGAEQGIPRSSLIRYIKEKGGYEDMSKFEKALATKKKEPAWWEKTLDFVNQGTMTPEQWGNAAEHLSGGMTLNFSNYLQAGIDMAASKFSDKPMSYGQAFANVHKRKAKAFEEDPGTVMFAEGLGGMLPGQKIAKGIEGISIAGKSLAPKVGEHISNFVKSVATNAATASGEATIMAGNDGRGMKEAAGMGALWGTAITPGMWGLGLIAKFGQRVWRRLNQAYNNKILLDPELAEEEAAQIWKELKRRDAKAEPPEEQLKAREEAGAAEETMPLDLAGPKGRGAYVGASIEGDTTPIFGNLTLKERQKNIRTRVGRYFSDMLGIKNIRGSIKKIEKELFANARDKANPYYQQTYTAPRVRNGRVEMGSDSINDGSGRLAEKIRLILDVLNKRGKMSPKQFYNNVQSLAKLEIDQLPPELKATAKIDDVLDPDDVSFATLDFLKKEIDEMVRTGDPKSRFLTLLNGTKNEMVAIGDELLLSHQIKQYNSQPKLGMGETVSPTGQPLAPPVDAPKPPEMSSWKQARNIYTYTHRMNDALKKGGEYFESGGNALDKINDLREMDLSPMELVFFRTAAYNKAADKLGKTISNPKGRIEDFMDESTQLKLEELVPDKEVRQQFNRRLEILQDEAFNNNFFKTETGSQTINKGQALNQPNIAVSAMDDINRKNYPSLINRTLHGDSQAQSTLAQDTVGEAMVRKGPDEIREVESRFGPRADKRLSDQMKQRAGLLSRMSGFGAGGLSLLSPRQE